MANRIKRFFSAAVALSVALMCSIPVMSADVEDIYIYGTDEYSDKSELLTPFRKSTMETYSVAKSVRLQTPKQDSDGDGEPDDESLWKWYTAEGDFVYITYPFTVETSGVYDMQVSAYKHDGSLSKYSFNIDGGADIAVSEENIEFTEEYPTNENLTDKDNEKLKNWLARYTMKQEFELEEGEHTLTVKVTKPRTDSDTYRAYHFMEYYRLSYVDPEQRVRAVEELIDKIGTVTKDSEADISEARNEYDKLKDEWKELVTNYDVLLDAELRYDDIMKKSDIYVYGADAYLDKSDIVDIRTTGNFEVAAAENSARFTTAAGVEWSEKLHITYPFTVRADGMYELEISAGKYTSTSLSDYAIRIDDGEEIVIDEPAIGMAAEHPGGGNLTTLMARYTLNKGFELEEGEHTISFVITKPRASDNRAYQFMEYFKLKYVEPEEKAGEVEEAINAIGTVTAHSASLIEAARAAYEALFDEWKELVSNYDVLLEAEKAYRIIQNGSEVWIWGDDEYFQKSEELKWSISSTFDNKKVAALTSDTLPQEGLYITYKFNIDIAGKYSLYTSTPIYNYEYMSTYAISVDDEDYWDVGLKNIEVNEPHPLGDKYKQYLARYKMKNTYELDEGEHTISIKLTSIRTSGDAYIFLEYLRFALDEEIVSAEFAEESGYVEIGETYVPEIKTEGLVSGGNVDISEGTVNYTSSNPAVAQIAGDGTVTPKKFGSTEISADIKFKGFTDTIKMTLNVTADGISCVPYGYYNEDDEKITSLSGLGEELSAKTKIFNNSDEDKTAVVILAVYDGNVLVKYTEEKYSLAAGEEIDASVTVDGIEHSDSLSAKLYMWGDEKIPCSVGFLEYIK